MNNRFDIAQVEAHAFTLGSFDYLWTAADPAAGLPADANRLVQRWFWWMLPVRILNTLLYC